MLINHVIGNLGDGGYEGKTIDYVDIEWHDVNKRIQRKISHSGTEIGIKFDDSILHHGLRQDDVLWCDSDNAIAVNIPEFEVISFTVEPSMVAKVCYEIGNRHATLFYGTHENEFITPYNEPMAELLSGLGVENKKEITKVNLDRAVSSSIHAHTHTH